MDSVVSMDTLDPNDESDAHFLALARSVEENFLAKGIVHAIHEWRFGLGIPGLVSVYLVRVTPDQGNDEEWGWLIAGELGSGVFNSQFGSEPFEVLQNYLGMMQEFAERNLSGESKEDFEAEGIPDMSNEAASQVLEILDEVHRVLESEMEDEDA